jgi:hypothetical protein
MACLSGKEVTRKHEFQVKISALGIHTVEFGIVGEGIVGV